MQATSKLQHILADVKHGQHILQEHIAQDKRARGAVVEGRHAQPGDLVRHRPEEEVLRVEIEGGAADDHGHAGRHGVAGRQVAAVHEGVHGWGVEHVVDGLGECCLFVILVRQQWEAVRFVS